MTTYDIEALKVWADKTSKKLTALAVEVKCAQGDVAGILSTLETLEAKQSADKS